MRILIVNANPLALVGERWRGKHTWNLMINNWAELGCDVTIWCPTTSEKSFDGNLPVVIHRKISVVSQGDYSSRLTWLRLLVSKWRIWSAKASQLVDRHDVVVFRLPSPMLGITSRAARRRNKPFIAVIAGDIAKSAGLSSQSSPLKLLLIRKMGQLVRMAQVWSCRDAAQLFAYGKELAQPFDADFSRTRVSRTAVVSRKDVTSRPRILQINKDFRVATVGWLYPLKSVEVAIYALARMESSLPRVSLTIVGSPLAKSKSYFDFLRAEVERLNLTSRVEFTGWLNSDEVGKVLSRTDALLSLGMAEGIPRCLAEAGAQGVPLIVTAVGGCKDVLDDRGNALLVSAGCVNGVADALKVLATSPELYETLSKGAIRYALDSSFEVEGAAILTEIEKTVQKRSQSSI